MVKPGLGLFTGRRKSSSNILEESLAPSTGAAAATTAAAAIATGDSAPSPDGYAPGHAHTDSGGFRLMSRTEVEKANERRKTMEKEKSTSKFARFSNFGTAGHKGRVQSFEEDSPGSSKRDSKSSNGTQFSSSRPYAINGQHGSTSTLPSSTDTSSDDNLFASVPRPQLPPHNSSPNSSLSLNGFRKQLPSLPKSSSGTSHTNSDKHTRDRSMTSSSYASTAIPPKLEADLSFGDGTFDDMFSDIKRKESPPESSRDTAGRSLLSEKRTFQADPIRINPKLHVEAPLQSWESRGSADNLMSPRSDTDSPPPPPPPHKYSQYAPVASESPTLPSSATFLSSDTSFPRKTPMAGNPYRDSSPELNPNSVSSSSANSMQTPVSSRSSNHTTNTTPKASLSSRTSLYTDNDDENLFAPAKVVPRREPTPVRRSPLSSVAESSSTIVPASAPKVNGRVLTQTEYLAMQQRANSQPPPEDDSDDEDYEDEEDAIRKREEEEIMRRKQQQMQFAREAMRRTTTAPSNLGNPQGDVTGLSMGFPSETSIKADEWEDEDVPLGILAQHGFPSQTRNRVPTQPSNAMPSYIPDRPASAGALTNGALAGHLPAFARGLPADPHSSFIGGGLVRPMNRESMGFNGFPRGPASIAGDSVAPGMGMGMQSNMMYQDAGMSQPSLVDQIQMRDMTKQKYMGGASNKKPQEGPFTGMLGQRMNSNGLPQNATRMPQMPMMNGMNGIMNPMMGGQMPMMGMGMGMGMGMNQMGYPMQQGQGNDMMAMQQMQQMQQMIAMQQMQLQQMQAMQQPQSQDPRMSMVMPNNSFGGNMMGNGSFLSVPGSMQNRPMSFMTVNGNQQQQQQPPMSNFMGPGPGYTPSIAPSERSNVGLSARYRPVVNNSDAHSTGTSMTLQASAGGNPNQPGMIKGIIKKVQHTPVEEDEDWSRMAARKNKFSGNKQQNNDLEALTKGLNI
ncbi:hypothetical protein GQ44DRAFT_771532 [Phaeosphaeriaceae sp. PMI808]|nr:hypothetical protein GQ44DRAFT_771532 [Phaeosphaeriaceae sp. PMI808]